MLSQPFDICSKVRQKIVSRSFGCFLLSLICIYRRSLLCSWLAALVSDLVFFSFPPFSVNVNLFFEFSVMREKANVFCEKPFSEEVRCILGVQRSKNPTTLPTQKVALRTPPPLPIQTFVTVPTSGLIQPLRDINPTKSNIYAGEKRSQNLEACHPFLFNLLTWSGSFFNILQQQPNKLLVRLLWLRAFWLQQNSYFTHNIAKNFWSQTFMKRFQFRSLTRLTLISNVET